MQAMNVAKLNSSEWPTSKQSITRLCPDKFSSFPTPHREHFFIGGGSFRVIQRTNDITKAAAGITAYVTHVAGNGIISTTGAYQVQCWPHPDRPVTFSSAIPPLAGPTVSDIRSSFKVGGGGPTETGHRHPIRANGCGRQQRGDTDCLPTSSGTLSSFDPAKGYKQSTSRDLR